MPKMTPKYVWRPGSAQNRWGSLSAPPDPLAAIEVVLLLRGEKGKGGEEKGVRREGKGKEGKGKGQDVAP